MERNIKELIAKMTLEEKAGLCSGEDFWRTKPVERLEIPQVLVSDGPHGLRKQDDNAERSDMNNSIVAVCFPAACATSCSFDRELMEEMGQILGDECQAENVSVLLGPAVNIKRSPLCGRNFEYISEDPYVAGELSASYINGVQSRKIGTSIKHFAANSQETRRMTASSNIDERTLREIYLPAFETAIKKSQPYTVMCSYNPVNHEYTSESHRLLTEILRDEWGFEGFVMSDWGAVNDRVKGIAAGLDLEMPSSNGVNDAKIIAAVKNGILEEKVLDTAVERILKMIFNYTDNRQKATFDRNTDHQKARNIAKECMVLLKNEGALPLDKSLDIAFIGEFAKKPRIQGGGSSHIKTNTTTSAFDAVSEICKVTYAQGYVTDEDRTDFTLLNQAISVAENAQVAVLFVGLPDSFESEGFDRKHLRMPDCQNKLIEEICKVQENVIIVLHNGAPIEIPWIDKVSAVLEVYLSGQATGEATVDILFGNANPCGKLAETFPKKLSDNPSYLTFGQKRDVDYNEGVFVGYRYYDTKEMEVLFPFGFGLSYTTFEYSNLKLSTEEISDKDTLEVTVDVTNTGNVAGKEIVQLYVSDKTNSAMRPMRELKGFDKVFLQPNETKTVSFSLDKRSFAWYNVDISDWYCASGEYEIQIGKSSRDIQLVKSVNVISTTKILLSVHENTVIGDFYDIPAVKDVAQRLMNRVAGNPCEAMSEDMQRGMVEGMPIRQIRSFGGISDKEIDEVLSELNRKLK